MRTSHPRLRVLRAVLTVIVLLTIIGGIAQIVPSAYIVTAQIDNTQPTQPFASVVDCIRMAQDINGSASRNSPRFVTTCYASRLHEGGYIAAGGDANNGDALPSDTAIVEFGDAQPDSSGDLYGVPSNGHAALSSVGEVGSVEGLAYQTGTNTAAPAVARAQQLFSGAYQKRLTRYGSGGPGGIYVTNRASGTTSLYVAIPNVVPGPTGAAYAAGDGTAARFPNDPAGNYAYTPEMGGLHRQGSDANEQRYVGKASLGDIEIDPQERFLYSVNLNNRRIYRVDTWSTTPQSTLTVLPDSVATLNPCSLRGGSQNYRPFGLLVTADSLYLGGVCSAETTGDAADLLVRIDRLVLATNTWSFTPAFVLNAFDAQRATWGGNDLRWHPWSSNGGSVYSTPQPIMSGLALDEAGNLVIGLRDRYGDLSSNGRTISESQGAGQGDLLLAAPNGAGGWNAPNSAGSEYFADGTPTQSSYPNGWIHGESTWGAVAYVPGTHAGSYGGEVVSTVTSPYRLNSGGVAWWNTTGGVATAREELYQTSTQTPNTFQKAVGLGDLELLCAWRAIGDRIWLDPNGNGVQDAGETNIDTVRVQLLDSSGNVVATVTTGTVNGMSGNYRFYVDPFATYTVRIDPTMYTVGQPLYGYAPTLPNAGSDDALDSDADANGTIAIPSAGNGDVNLTYDVGVVNGANVRITKTGPATALPGQTMSFNLAYANDGPAPAQNVTVVDTLPASMTYVNASPAPTSVSGTTITWNLGTIAAGASGTITVNAAISASATGQYTNQSQISTTTPNDTPGDNTSTSTVDVLRPNVTITKAGPAVVTAGGSIAYTLAYANNGNVTAAGVSVVDTLPAGVSLISAVPAPASVSGQTVTWNVGSLGVGASGSISVNAQVAAALVSGTQLPNQVQISTTTAGDDPSDNSSGVTTTVQRADVTVTKSSSNSFPVASGQPVTYYLDFANLGPAAAATVVLADVAPAQLTSVAWSCTSGCSGSGSGNTISITLGTLAAGATGRVTVTGTAQTTVAREDFVNTATISTATPETDTTNNQSSVPGAVWTTDLQIVKLAQPQVAAGATFTATLRYKNNGPAPAMVAQMTDTLPVGVSVVSASPAPSSQSGQTLTWNLGTLADQAVGAIDLVLRAAPTLANLTTVINQSQISTTTTDRTSSNDTSNAQTLVVTRADVAVVKTGPARVSAGDAVSFIITATNTGPSVARAVVVEDALPSELDFVSANPTPTTNSAGVRTWAIGDMNPGASSSITVQMHSRFDQPEATLNATNTVRVTTTTTDETPSNNTSSHTVAVETVDLSVTKTMPSLVVAGVPFTATLTYANAGPATAMSVTLRDLLPVGLTYLSASPVPNGPGLRWNLGSLPIGGTGTIIVRMRAPTTAISGTQYLNQAIIDTLSSDRDPANDIDQAPTIVRPNADLAVVKTGPAGPLLGGSAVAYTLAYANAGPSQATAAQVVDTLPVGFTFTSAIPAPTTNSGGVLIWHLGDLAPGAAGSITVRGTLAGDGMQVQRTNTAIIRSATDDPTPTNNSSTVTTIVQQPDLVVTKSDGVTRVTPGDSLTYQLTVRNTGPITATAAVLTETPPAALPITDPAWTLQPNGSYTQPLGNLAPGATVTRMVTLVVPIPLPIALQTQIVNSATVADSCGCDPTPANNSSTDTDTPQPTTAVKLAYLLTENAVGGGYVVRWGTLAEYHTRSFRIARTTTTRYTNPVVVGSVASTSSLGADYRFSDPRAPTTGPVIYWLIEIETGGHETRYGPASATLQRATYQIYLPLTRH